MARTPSAVLVATYIVALGATLLWWEASPGPMSAKALQGTVVFIPISVAVGVLARSATAPPRIPVSTHAVTTRNGWRCTRCTEDNPPRRSTCQRCNGVRA